MIRIGERFAAQITAEAFNSRVRAHMSDKMTMRVETSAANVAAVFGHAPMSIHMSAESSVAAECFLAQAAEVLAIR